MTPLQDQVAYYLSRMRDRVEYRCFWPHYKHQALQLEKDWPEYAGLVEATKAALRARLGKATP